MFRLKEILDSKNLEAKDLANMLGVTENTLSRQRNSKPSVATLEKWAVALDVSVRDLFTYDKSKEPIHLIINQELHTFDTFDELKKFVNS